MYILVMVVEVCMKESPTTARAAMAVAQQACL